MVDPVVVIAEAGVNHNGRPDLALQLVDAAADAGADMIKFQTFKAEKLVTRGARKADYQMRNTGSAESQLAMLRELELDDQAHRDLMARCEVRGIRFLSTPFDDESTDFLIGDLGLRTLKVGSGDLTNGPHLLRLARSGVDVILSTGMATMAEVAEALGVLAYGYLGGQEPGSAGFADALSDSAGQKMLSDRVFLLHCTSNYPAPCDEINLAVMDTYRDEYPCRVGLSDHSDGISVPIAAVGRGARMIEKHLTLDRSLPGPDHLASIEPTSFSQMVRSIREIEQAIGSGSKAPTSSELETRSIARKSLVASRRIEVGEIFDFDNVVAKRPGSGLAPNFLWRLVGCRAKHAYDSDEMIGDDELAR